MAHFVFKGDPYIKPNGNLPLKWCAIISIHCPGTIILAKKYPSVTHLIVSQCIYHPGSFTQLTPGTPVGEHLITHALWINVADGWSMMHSLIDFPIISYHRLSNNIFISKLWLFIVYIYMNVLTSVITASWYSKGGYERQFLLYF